MTPATLCHVAQELAPRMEAGHRCWTCSISDTPPAPPPRSPDLCRSWRVVAGSQTNMRTGDCALTYHSCIATPWRGSVSYSRGWAEVNQCHCVLYIYDRHQYRILSLSWHVRSRICIRASHIGAKSMHRGAFAARPFAWRTSASVYAPRTSFAKVWSNARLASRANNVTSVPLRRGRRRRPK